MRDKQRNTQDATDAEEDACTCHRYTGCVVCGCPPCIAAPTREEQREAYQDEEYHNAKEEGRL